MLSATLTRPTRLLLVSVALLLAACGGDDGAPVCPGASSCDAGTDTGGADAGGSADAGPAADGGADAGAPVDAGSDAAPGDAGTPTGATWVVSPAWLEEHLGEVQVLSVRAEAAWRGAHVAGSVRVDPNAVRATVAGISGQVAPLADVQAALRAAGLLRETPVIVEGDATDTNAARMVWTLAYYGHADVRLLDGGFPRWQSEGRAVDTAAPTITPSTYTIDGPVDALRVDADWVAARLDDANVFLVDARTASEYAAGHIPGALSVDWMQNVSAGSLRPDADLAALYAAIPEGATVVAYCQTGSRASVAWLVAAHLGWADVRLYDGSWAEWGSRADLPKE